MTSAKILASDNLSMSSGFSDDLSPRFEARKEDIDHSVCTLGPFLDLLFEKVELMPTNSLSMNFLVTSILSQLASYPQPLLRAILTHPDIVLQPSVRGLYIAIASLRQKLDNIMPTFPGSDEAILASRRHLQQRLTSPPKRNSVSVISTITQLSNEAGRVTKNSISSAFSSIFRTVKKTSNPASPVNHSHSSMSSTGNVTSSTSTEDVMSRFEPEVRGYAMAAVILEEWLQELAAIAQEQSVLMKEIAFHVGIMPLDNNQPISKKNSSAIWENQTVCANNLEPMSMS